MPEPTEVPQIQSITFGDRIEITYLEQRNVYKDGGFKAETLVIPADTVREELEDVVESIQSLIDAYLTWARSPAKTIRG